MESAASLLMVLGCGFILLKPADVPTFARYAGRLVGFSVRTMRQLQGATESAITQGEQMLSREGGNVGAVREDLQASLSKFESLRSTMSKDMAGVRAFTPVEMIRARIRSKQTQLQQRANQSENVPKSETATTSAVREYSGVRKVSTIGSVAPNRSGTSAGVDFIARSIEEAALAKQKERFFGGKVDKAQESNMSNPNPHEGH